MRALRAIEEVFCSVVFGFQSGGIGVWVGDFGAFTVHPNVHTVPESDEGRECGSAENVAREEGY